MRNLIHSSLFLGLVLWLTSGCAAIAAQNSSNEKNPETDHAVGSHTELKINENYWLTMDRAHKKCRQHIRSESYGSQVKFAEQYFVCMRENRSLNHQQALSSEENKLIQIIEGRYPDSWQDLSWGEVAYQKFEIERFSPSNISITADHFKNEDGINDNNLLKQKCAEVESGNSFLEMMILADHSRKYTTDYQCQDQANIFFRYVYRHCWRDVGLCGAGNLLLPSTLILNRAVEFRIENRDSMRGADE